MRDIRIAAAQFEHSNNDKAYNLSRIRELSKRAVAEGAEVVSFHECSISAYTFVQEFTKEQLLEVAEVVPNGPSTNELISIAKDCGVPILAGLFEQRDGEVFNTYICVDGDGLIAKFSKIHAFISPHLTSGSEFVVFDLLGCRCGMLICYDNNLVENVRMTTMLGADIIFMPHVTGCLPSVMPGRGLVDPELWYNRDNDPVALRKELWGPKGRDWLMRWLPARAYENGIYAIFTNPIGLDDGQVRNGNSMILDPFGEVISECHQLGDDLAIALCTADKINVSSGRRYIRARRPELYGKFVEPQSEAPVTAPGWDLKHKKC
ncbi:MAG: nitrilase [Planctomycetaceae bacterium]|nr:nitrilase [Planctomycetaceae bacterium]